MTENEKDIALLRSDPHALIVKYQPTVRIIALRFVGKRSSKLDDLIQTVNEALMMRIASIQRNYNGRSTVATYVSAVVWNICRTAHTASKSEEELLGNYDPPDPAAESLHDKPAIGQAARALDEVIELVPADRSRLMILLPLHFKMPLTENRMRKAYSRCTSEQVQEILHSLGGNISLMNEFDIYSLITPFLNAMEGRSTSIDGHRRWFSNKIPEIIRLLNVRLGGASFGSETLQTLIERMSFQNLF